MDEGTSHLQSLDHFGGIDYRDDAFFRHHCLGGTRVKPKVLYVDIYIILSYSYEKTTFSLFLLYNC